MKIGISSSFIFSNPKRPHDVKNSKPNLIPPTWGEIWLTKSKALSISLVSIAQKIGLSVKTKL